MILIPVLIIIDRCIYYDSANIKGVPECFQGMVNLSVYFTSETAFTIRSDTCPSTVPQISFVNVFRIK